MWKPGIVVTAAMVCLALLAPYTLWADAGGPFQPDPNGGGGGGGCDYCGQTACGCNAPPPGYYLSFSCECSSNDCYRSCTYYHL